ncbi:piezo-type mechanosensitive ion channel component 1 isoform X5 [Onychostruthus taczanowskii]|uniref:piezo-type mechanosensitive ion channel component 1 isoform X5 n=1 Tax=Onychostruthus taczanowskii TaxID=356909 RepID=UPI001B80E4A2|nr:piezo-type mechanosensitive ion channel component 1 isoform X5 [Onychostruthus taczanowskii]
MNRRGLCQGLYWLLLPLALLAACLFRYNVLSLVYLLFLLLLPWFPGPSSRFTTGHSSRILKALLGISILFLLAHLVFQICLYTLPVLDQLLGPSCSSWEVLARHIGVTRLDLSDILNSVRLVAPDVGILLVSSLSLCLCRRLSPAPSRGNPESLESSEWREEKDAGRQRRAAHRDSRLRSRLRDKAHSLLWEAGKGLSILLLALAGITLPSASSSVYFLLFMGLCTWWACHLPSSHQAFNVFCVLVGIYSACHLLCLYAYQTPFVQGVFPPPTIWARVFGFKDIILYYNCSQPNTLDLNNSHPWPVYANPGVLLLLYYTVATLVKLRWRDAKRTVAPARPRPRDLVELESWPQDTHRVAEDTKPMLYPSTGKPGASTENCTVHVLNTRRRHPSAWLPLRSLGHVLMKQSYVSALIAMMVWSIMYHSWLTFVLLLWACLIWTVRSRRHFAMLCSPFLVLYAIALCSLQYVWAMDVVAELPTHISFMHLQPLGLVHHSYPCMALGAKLLLTLTFWMLLRRFVTEKVLTRRAPATPLLEVSVAETETSQMRDVLHKLGEVVRNFFAKFWICVCAAKFIVVTFAGRLVLYKIVYMLLLLLCLMLFQVYYSLWRKVLKGFWWLVVAYTMLVLIATYTYQFEDFPMYWRNITGLNDDQLSDMGLQQFSVSKLFSSILMMGFFLLACILQLHYFHEPFMLITDLQHIRPPSPAPDHIPSIQQMGAGAGAPGRAGPRLLGQGDAWGGLREAPAGAPRRQVGGSLHCLGGPGGGLGDELLAGAAVDLGRALLPLPPHGLVPLHRLDLHHHRLQDALPARGRGPPRVLQQLHPAPTQRHQPDPRGAGQLHAVPWPRGPCQLVRHPQGLPQLGIRQEPPAGAAAAGVRGRGVPAPAVPPQAAPAGGPRHRDRLRGHLPRAPGPRPCQLRQILHQLLLLQVRFGDLLPDDGERDRAADELRGDPARLLARGDADAAAARGHRPPLAQVLPLPRHLLHLPVPAVPGDTTRPLHGLSVALEQYHSPQLGPRQVALPARLLRGSQIHQPHQSYLDMVKVVVFHYFFWVVLVVVFITGTNRISLFGLGYVLACFYLLLSGTAMLRKPARARLVLWDCLILYNIAVIISKNMLSLLSCVFVQQMQSRFCWVIQLFSLVCTVKGYYNPKAMPKDHDCTLPVEEAGIIWDSICFFFLLLQRRIFLSSYYLHVMWNLRASALQASRGVALFKASILKSLRSHRQAERKSLDQLKRQMERIRAKQQKYHQELATSAGQEGARAAPGGPADPSRQRERWWRPWLDHAAVLHSGEYFLFESDSEEEEEVQEEPRPGRPSAFQLAYQAWVTNTRTVLQQQEQPEQPRPPSTDSAAGDGTRREVEAAEGAEGQEEEDGQSSERSNVLQRVLNMLRFLWLLCQALVDGLTQWLDSQTREHTDMSQVLCLERFVMAERLARGEEINQEFPDELYERELPPEELLQKLSSPGSLAAEFQSSTSSNQEQVINVEDVADAQQFLAVPQQRRRTASELLKSRRLCVSELEESERFYRSHNRFLKLLLAGYRFGTGHSELLCYFTIILNNMVTGSVISLFLPILVFLWAMLSSPRPTKRFWVTAIIFTEMMVVVKYLFQFGFFPWNGYITLLRNEGKPFFPPRILGLEKSIHYIKYDLLQLLALFFHRSLLLSYGLWDQEKTTDKKDESKEGEEKPEEAVSLQPEVAEEGLEAPAQPGALEAASELEGESVEQEEGTEATQLRFRRKQRRKTTEMVPVEGGEEEEEEEEVSAESHAQRKLKAFGLRVKSFFLTTAQNVYQPVCQFCRDILDTQSRAATDVYAYMFLADVVDFIIIIFGFWAFGKYTAAADITSSLSENQVPKAFLFMLLFQFSTMVIDRALYLRKTVLGKLVFQVTLVFGIHIWMFFILPYVTQRLFRQNTVAQLWYFVKCIYFGLSAYQIRCGYPTRILGNFLTKKYNHLNLFLFQGFRLVPFLVELRAVMDWVWTDTTLSLSNWMCVEDIYANIFIIKCSRETEKKYPQPKGQKKKKVVKYGMGGLIILFLVGIIWFPLLFMSLVRSVVGIINHPIDVTVTLKLGGYEPLFSTSSQQQYIQPFTSQDYEELTKEFESEPLAMQFISLYDVDDIVTARIEGSSGSLWSVSPPSREQMRLELQNGSSDITLHFNWIFQRDLGKGGTVENAYGKHDTDLEPGAPQRLQLAQLLDGTRKEPVELLNLFPKYIRAPTGLEAEPIKQLLPDDEDSYLDVEVHLKQERRGSGPGEHFVEWWVLRQKNAPPQQGNILPMIIFNDKVSPPSLGFLAGYGIMGLYVSVVLVIGKFVRGFFSEVSHSIMFEELPYVDRILKLCQDIFLVRETGELELEEELYAKLIFLYRSPETMIKWTREKE